MDAHRTFAVAAIAALLVLDAGHLNAGPLPRAHLPSLAAVVPDACSLLTVAEVSSVLEIASLPGKPVVAGDRKHCMWSDDPDGAISNRRVTLSIITTMAFDVGKSVPRITTEPAPGIGDDAYYEIFRGGSPALCVRKGASAVVIQMLNGGKFKAFAPDALKQKEAQLAKAAVAKL